MYLNYTDQGKGKTKTIVFLHGFTESLTIWNSFSEILSKKYRVICIDLPGHGKSPCLGEVHLMEDMAKALNNVINKLQPTPFVIVGHSMGGYVALSYAKEYTEKVKGLCLFHSQAAPDSPEVKANRTRTIEAVKQDHITFINQFIPDLFAPSNRERLKSEIDLMKNEAKVFLTKESIIASQEGMRQRKDQYDFLAKTNIPILFIAGKQDSRIPLEKVTEQLILPKHAEALILDIGHMGYLEAPKETLSTLDFFADKVLNS
jgi:pimeloyl-ACP methyl ester carboxylesterase